MGGGGTKAGLPRWMPASLLRWAMRVWAPLLGTTCTLLGALRADQEAAGSSLDVARKADRDLDPETDCVGQGQFDLRERPARSEDPDARGHPLPGADDGDRLVRGEVGVLLEPFHRRELIARAEQDVDIRLRQMGMPRRDVDDQVRAMPRGRRGRPVGSRLPLQDRPDQAFHLFATEAIGLHGGTHASMILGPFEWALPLPLPLL